jgi:orotate phosphoribosyltransferase
VGEVQIKPFKRVLVANRGEIAIRVYRALNELGITTVGIYSKEDRYALFRSKADESYQLKENKGPVDAYLDIKGIGGMTLGADPLISATTVISHEKGRPLAGLIVRKESKGHGTNQYVEGLSNFKPGDPVAMVEDVVTTGGSLLKACERVKDAGLNVVAVCTVLDRGEGGREAIEAAGYQLRALFTRPELVELAKED